jgi:ABC transporter substrate binding protein (PQQ-dependent alcohol dehydrogenase system)
MLVFNARAPDDRLRNEDCRPNILHTALSRAMQADALAQYLAVKNWRRWFILRGQAPADTLTADALRRAAERFGHRIVTEKTWTFSYGPGRADSGHVALQSEIPTLTRPGTGGGDYDVLIVADETNMFGEYLPDRTFLPRPVAGTQGLTPVAWSVVHEQWGAAQLQDRFHRQAGRPMTTRDYAAWLAVRAVGEAAVRSRSVDPARLTTYLHGAEFVLAGFKGQGLSFRAWDGQLRQPVLLAGPKLLVSVSPQPGFLHERSELDTLGDDQGDSRCRR